MNLLRAIAVFVTAFWISTSWAQVIVADGKNLAVSEFRVEAGPVNTMRQVVGIAKNIGDVTMSNVIVEINLYDEQNVLVGNTAALGMNLAPGETWRFVAPAPVRFHRAVIAKLSAYK
jgi:hypothetical protein